MARRSTHQSAPLWARLKRFHADWTGREDQLRSTPDYQSPGSRGAALEQALVFALARGVSWTCPPDKLVRLDAMVLTKPQHQAIDGWTKQWNQEYTMINPNWFPEDQPTFSFLQYDQLTEDQLRAKIAQLPSGTRLRWQFLQPPQVYPPVSIARQDAVYERIHAAAVQHGVVLEKTNHPYQRSLSGRNREAFSALRYDRCQCGRCLFLLQLRFSPRSPRRGSSCRSIASCAVPAWWATSLSR